MSVIVKLKVLLVLTLGVLGFGVLGWRFFQPSDPGEPISFVAQGINWTSVGMGMVLAVLVSGLGTIFGGAQGEYIGPLAVPAGLTALSIRSGNMERMLIEHVDGARETMFFGMMGEVLFWGFLVAIGFMVARILGNMMTSNPEESLEASVENPQKPAKSGSGKVSPRPNRQGNDVRHRQSRSRLMNGLLAAGFCGVVTLLLLLILVQSETEPLAAAGEIQVGGPPPVKQIIFATGLAFFLGALASHQLFEVRLGWFLLSLLLVSFLVYGLGAYKGVLPTADVPPQFLPKSVLFATILPIQFVGIGALTILTGYWYSFEMHTHHRARHLSA